MVAMWMEMEFKEKGLDEYYIPILEEYQGNNSKKLKDVVNKLIKKHFGEIPQMDLDEYYSVADSVLTDIVIKNQFDKNQSFDGYLYRAVEKKIFSLRTAENTTKRSGKIRNKQTGEIDHDSGYKIVSMDAPMDEDSNSTIGDFLCSKTSDFDLFDVTFGHSDDTVGKVDTFLSKLSKIEREVAEAHLSGLLVKDIKEKFGLCNRQYENIMRNIRQNKAVRMFNKNRRTTCKKQEVISMNVDVIECNEINDITDIPEEVLCNMLSLDATDNHRTETNTLSSLLDDKACGMIDCEYISQRQPFQWTPDQVNKFLSRILNNQPIPEIVICEKNTPCGNISYLIDGLQRLTYAEEFKEGRIKIGAKGAEFYYVLYRDIVKDENGQTSIKTKYVNIIGKRYKELPKPLQKRFDNYNFSVTRYFNCTEDLTDYHIRNYNNHTAMTKSQYAITNVGNKTSALIKGLSEDHNFFKNVINCTSKGKKNGTLEEVVSKTMMTMFYLDEWKKEVVDMMKYLDAKANVNDFEKLRNHLDNLAIITEPIAKDLKDLFTTTNTHIWLAVYDKATEIGISDEVFVDFMKDFAEKIHSNDMENDEFMITYKARNTKDKKVIVDKVNGLFKMLCEFARVEISENEEVNSVEIDVDNTETGNEDLINSSVNTDNNKSVNSKENQFILDDYNENFVTQFGKGDLLKKITDKAIVAKLAFESLALICNKHEVDLHSFVEEHVSTQDEIDDVLLFLDVIDELTLDIDNNCDLLRVENIPALVKLVEFTSKEEIDEAVIINWLKDFSKTYKYVEKNSYDFYKEMKKSLMDFSSSYENNEIIQEAS